MKLLFAFFFTILTAFPPQDNCGCMPAAKNEITRWGGNETITVEEEKIHKRIFGTVELENGDPAADVLVEVYTRPEEEKEEAKQRRIAACITGGNGKFCFGFTKPGKYEIRLSKDSGFNVTHVSVEVNPYGDESTDTEIAAPLTLGH